MIPRAHITAWRARAPWPLDTQVEQDLVLSRALIDIFSEPVLNKALAFRGGTALHKLYFDPPGRYSEDIDLVQVEAGPAGGLMSALHGCLNPWLGKPKTKQGAGRITYYYRFDSESLPVTPMRLKVEINTREHFTVLGLVQKEVVVDSRWFTGRAAVTTYAIEELLGTKLRALYGG
ncbi:MAG: nucleotidyl transferase AbiEii/AbiGii toxin family protein [Deltaproteobacteria bacterium]|nr:nucleotidyl transferase AbiEii/AbiGii toxin family protein [Deltaproteobacteria bacterium]